MQDSLSNLVDNLSEINNKEPKNKFMDTEIYDRFVIAIYWQSIKDW